jgi:hypothetical protein
MKGRYITDGVMLLQEVLRESKYKKQQGVVLKIDFEKAYDKVNWNFLFDCCSQKGFSDSWLVWIKNVVTNGTLSVKVNDNVGPYFASCKGVRQGDPFAPFLFNMAANSLSKMVSLAQQNGLITGLANNLVENGIALLQYADDTILLIQDNADQAVNLKLILYIFETMFGLKINFEKSEVMMVLDDEEKAQFFASLFNCQQGSWPIKYLGTPVCARRPTVAEMKFLGEKTKKKMSGWVGNAMSIGGE